MQHNTTRAIFLAICFLILSVSPAFAVKDYNIKNNTTSFLFVNGTTGNVGIGTTVPSQKLEVNGEITVGGSGVSYFTSNVGIGSTVPSQALDVVGTVKATAFIGNGALITNITGVISGMTTNAIPRASSATTVVDSGIYALANGNVGIGSTAPTAPLNVVGDTAFRGAVEIDLQ